LLVYGDKGESGTINLESGRDDFERGHQDIFEFESVDLGDLKRIEIGKKIK
jgi:IS4 transposase